MLLAMRRESEHHHHTSVPPVVVSATGAVATPTISAAANTHNSHNLTVSTSATEYTDSLNTPSTPLLNLGRSPLQFTAPPPPPASIAGPQFGFYTPTTPGTSPYFHHYSHPTPTYASASSVGIHASNVSYSSSSTENSRTAAPPPTEELEEFVDIFQVQHLLLDHSAANGQQPPPPHSLMPSNTLNSIATTLSSDRTTANNSESSSLATTTTTASTTATTTTTTTSLAKPQPRPRLNLQKASEYAAQRQADSPSSRRMLLDYPSPYLYGNHYHSSPSEDLVALWFGSNGSGNLCYLLNDMYHLNILGLQMPKKTSVKSINLKQKQVMAEFMSEHPNLARNLLPNCGQGRITSNRLWETLTVRLNSFGPPTKNDKSWRKVFTDQKFSVKKKLSLNKASKKKTGGGPYEEILLTSAEEQIIEAAGIDVAVEGLPNVKSFGCANQTVQYLMDTSLASEYDSEHEGCGVSASKSTTECSSKPVSENYSGRQNKEGKPTKKSVTKLELLKSNISKVEEHQKNMASKLDRLIQLKERSLKLKEEQHIADMKNKMLDFEIKSIKLEMVKKQM